MFHKSVLLGYSRRIPSKNDRPLSGTPHLNSRIAVWEMNFMCLWRGRLRTARFTIACTPSWCCFKRLCTLLNHTYKFDGTFQHQTRRIIKKKKTQKEKMEHFTRRQMKN